MDRLFRRPPRGGVQNSWKNTQRESGVAHADGFRYRVGQQIGLCGHSPITAKEGIRPSFLAFGFWVDGEKSCGNLGRFSLYSGVG